MTLSGNRYQDRGYSYSVELPTGEKVIRTTRREKGKSTFTDTSSSGQVLKETNVEKIGKGQSLLSSTRITRGYDPYTGTYTSSSGEGYSVRPQDVNKLAGQVEPPTYIISGQGYSIAPELLQQQTKNQQQQQTIIYPEIFKSAQEQERNIRTNKMSSLPYAGVEFQQQQLTGAYKVEPLIGVVQPATNIVSQDFIDIEKQRAYSKPLFQKSSTSKETLGAVLPAFAFATARVGYKFGQTTKQIVKSPVVTLVQQPFDFATELVSNFKGTTKSVGESITGDPFGFVGEQAAYIGSYKVAGKSVVVGKNLYVSKGSYAFSVGDRPIYVYKSKSELAPETIFDVSSLDVPSYTRSSGILESVKSFQSKKGMQIVSGFERVNVKTIKPGEQIIRTESTVVSPDYVARLVSVPSYSRTYRPVVQTSSSGSLPIKGVVQAQEGSKGFMGLEDPGIYVNPEGRGSGAPLGVGGVSGYTFNPVGAFSNLFDVPTVSKIRVSSVERYPRSVINIPGFEGVGEYGRSVSGRGGAFITKRSELAFGSVKSQSYFNKFFGKVKKETGSAELEAIIPVDSKFGFYKGKDKFTVYQGRAVRVRSGETLVSEKVLSKGLYEVSGEKLKYESDVFSSSIKGGRKTFLDPSRVGSSILKSNSKFISSFGLSGKSSGVSSVSSDISSGGISKVSGVSSAFSGISSNVVLSKVSGVSGRSGGISKVSGVSSASSNFISSSKIVPPTSVKSFPYESSKSVKRRIRQSYDFKLSAPRGKETKFFVIPDLRSVFVTEQALGGKRAMVAKQTSQVRSLSYSALRGQGVGFVPTEQIRTGKVKLR